MFIVFSMLLIAFTSMMFYFGYIAVRNFCQLFKGQEQPAYVDNRIVNIYLNDQIEEEIRPKRSVEAIEMLTGM